MNLDAGWNRGLSIRNHFIEIFAVWLGFTFCLLFSFGQSYLVLGQVCKSSWILVPGHRHDFSPYGLGIKLGQSLVGHTHKLGATIDPSCK